MLAVSPYFPSFVEFRVFLPIIVAISFFQKLFPIVPDLRHPLPKERQGNAKIPKNIWLVFFLEKREALYHLRKVTLTSGNRHMSFPVSCTQRILD